MEQGNAERESEVSEQMNRLESNLTSLCNDTKALCSRLVTVVKPSLPSDKEDSKKEAAELVPLAARIRDSTRSIISLNFVVKDTLERLEL